MNILHHKSWHVYSRKNREKVVEDEAKADLENQQKQTKEIAEKSKDRLQKLRERASDKYQREHPHTSPSLDSHIHEEVTDNQSKDSTYIPELPTEDNSTKSIITSFKHDNEHQNDNLEDFDADLQSQLLVNLEKEVTRVTKVSKDIIVKKEKEEPRPWYASEQHDEGLRKLRHDIKDKAFNDPLMAIHKRLKLRDPQHKNPYDKNYRDYRSHHHKEFKSGPHQRERSRNDKSERKQEKLPEKHEDPMTKLRQARLERERKERARAEELLGQNHTLPESHTSAKYNPSFNIFNSYRR